MRCSSYDAAKQRAYDEIKDRVAGYARYRKLRDDIAAARAAGGGTVYVAATVYLPPDVRELP